MDHPDLPVSRAPPDPLDSPESLVLMESQVSQERLVPPDLLDTLEREVVKESEDLRDLPERMAYLEDPDQLDLMDQGVHLERLVPQEVWDLMAL